MGIVREALYWIFGPKLYFKIVSSAFLFLFRNGFLKPFNRFKGHYLAGKLVNEGDYVIDIGANLGYFTTIFALNSGASGKVIAVEPVELYRKILKSNTGRFKNLEILPFALGDTEVRVAMGIPHRLKSRHGLTRIIGADEAGNIETLFQADVRKPENIFMNIAKLDYIKCDIEGHEDRVIPGFKQLIEKYRPIIQIELAEENYSKIEVLLTVFGYSAYFMEYDKLKAAVKGEKPEGDIFFLTSRHIDRYPEILTSPSK